MRSKTLSIFLLLFGLISLIILLFIPSDPKNAVLFGYSVTRIILTIILLGINFIVLTTCVVLYTSKETFMKADNYLSGAKKGSLVPSLIILLSATGVVFSIIFFYAWYKTAELYGAVFLRLFPLVLFVGLLSGLFLLAMRAYHAEFVSRYYQARDQISHLNRNKLITWGITLVVFGLLGVVYFQLSSRHSREINQSPDFSDQESYLYIAEEIVRTDYQYKGDRNRTPLYPYLLTLVYEGSIDSSTFFSEAKKFSIFLSIGTLAFVFIISMQFLPLWHTVVLTAINAIGIYVYKAGYVQPELLFYALNFASFILMCLMLTRPGVFLGILTGITLALTYLTKASILPGLALFLVIYVIKLIYQVILTRSSKNSKDPAEPLISTQLGAILLLVITFLGLLFPYIQENKKMFGSYFYNVNSTFYIWYDTWEQVENGTSAHGDDVGWPDMPADEIPSLIKYIQEHSPAQMAERIISGVISQAENLSHPYGRINYLLIYTLSLMVFLLLDIRASFVMLHKHLLLVTFCTLYFAGYLLLFSWYSPIAEYHDERFTYGLFLPYLFAVFVALHKMTGIVPTIKLRNRILHTSNLVSILHTLIMLGSFYEFVTVAAKRMSNRWYGK